MSDDMPDLDALAAAAEAAEGIYGIYPETWWGQVASRWARRNAEGWWLEPPDGLGQEDAAFIAAANPAAVLALIAWGRAAEEKVERVRVVLAAWEPKHRHYDVCLPCGLRNQITAALDGTKDTP